MTLHSTLKTALGTGRSTRLILTVVVATVMLALGTGCISRYTMDLFFEHGSLSKKIDVESTEFVHDALLNSPFEREKIILGQGNCVVIHVGTRGETLEKEPEDLIAWDRHVRYDIYLQLPSRVEPTTINLENNSYVQLYGEYDRPPEDRVFSARDGLLVLDSIPNKFLYATIDGVFVNPLSDTVKFQGQFRVRTQR